MEKSVESLMMKDHNQIRKLLEDFLHHKSEENFSKFKWELERHFFVEENAIFQITDSMIGDEVSDTFELMKQHGEIMGLMNNLELNFANGGEIDASKLESVLKSHALFEDEVFYPKLDELLTPAQKEKIKVEIAEKMRG